MRLPGKEPAQFFILVNGPLEMFQNYRAHALSGDIDNLARLTKYAIQEGLTTPEP